MTAEHHLFVYGLLLQGEASHELLASARFLGEARTAPSYSLIDLGPHPGLVAGGAHAVSGELFALDVATLARIDVHEGHPVLFKRRTIQLDDGREAFAYLLDMDQVRGRRRIRSNAWRTRLAGPAPPPFGVRDAALVKWARTRKP